MQFTKVTAVCFSPAGSTRAAALRLAGALAEQLNLPCAEIDITLPAGREQSYNFSPDELVVFASPTYAGRLPNKIQPTFAQNFQGQGTAAVPLVLFGNRSFQDSLAELTDLLSQNGFIPVGAAAMVSRHVFSDKLAPGRPGPDDFAALDDFARSLSQLLAADDALAPVQVPGNHPAGPYYTPLGLDGQPAKFLKAVPKVSDACTGCGRCVSVCPMGSIPAQDPRTTQGVCIKCQACIRACPQHARFFDDAAFLSHVAMLEQNYTAPQKNSFYF